ncbi:uncharacterized protein L969DRAFT_43588 [Mixia osmundae IAM 14324]|uniref:Uncharacterized protein n=1 Tax=Mixia osmundae (strain CBS 9802 / IAM 14324 / JCM 22182 / KY 12970) TaxID=764103 RepID=G7E379_MIXOS|nr:uncharacterized protein L969DRAFT_43588 [Mixia osmundae IAM 14324]KEI42451.1 hypothetical protein L969DRAFT_43588 [Mixia osmundae IAM 14324]GAA97260.1 hypothetical protein E5Q_03937 [Mixia osmundae IAM 14324]
MYHILELQNNSTGTCDSTLGGKVGPRGPGVAHQSSSGRPTQQPDKVARACLPMQLYARHASLACSDSKKVIAFSHSGAAMGTRYWQQPLLGQRTSIRLRDKGRQAAECSLELVAVSSSDDKL